MENCTLPLTGSRCVDLIITNKGVFEVDKIKGITLIELAEDVTLEKLRLETGCEFKVRNKFELKVSSKSLSLFKVSQNLKKMMQA